jgi:hypothetical protein
LGEANQDGSLLLDEEAWLAPFGKKVDCIIDCNSAGWRAPPSKE